MIILSIEQLASCFIFATFQEEWCQVLIISREFADFRSELPSGVGLPACVTTSRSVCNSEDPNIQYDHNFPTNIEELLTI